ncbi:MAG TPA: hypothetical protein VG916_12460 [Gemmatimonadaceae bacterium]|nr:hypothetical protein [Gemmatimonadaceae bacterium]
MLALDSPDAVLRRLLSAVRMAGIGFVLVGEVADAVHGLRATPAALELVCDFTAPQAATLAETLNALRARPRAVVARTGFLFDASVIRAIGDLILHIDGASVDIAGGLPGIGDYTTAQRFADTISTDDGTYLVLSRDGLQRAHNTELSARATGGGLAP